VLAEYAALAARPRLSTSSANRTAVVAAGWNAAVHAALPGWPRFPLKAPCRREPYALPLDAYPAAFAAEVETFRRGSPAPTRPAVAAASCSIRTDRVGRCARRRSSHACPRSARRRESSSRSVSPCRVPPPLRGRAVRADQRVGQRRAAGHSRRHGTEGPRAAARNGAAAAARWSFTSPMS
jgi:hypothetical protein